jgi:hypothetical protein
LDAQKNWIEDNVNHKTLKYDTIYSRNNWHYVNDTIRKRVVANVVLTGTKGNNSGWIVITTGWAFAVLLA